MLPSAHDLEVFYKTGAGAVVQEILGREVKLIWPDLSGKVILGLGYTTPYLIDFSAANHSFYAINQHEMPYTLVSKGGNKSFVSHANNQPFADQSIDRILAVHHLEFTHKMKAHLAELRRLLVDDGRLLVVVPNRHGLWAKAEWTPFGNGMPFGYRQVIHYLQDNGFETTKVLRSLFVPPTRNKGLLKSNGLIESLGKKATPFLNGVYVIEVKKKLNDKSGGEKVQATDLINSIGLFPAKSS